MKKPKVIITRRLQDRVEKRMRELFNVDLSDAAPAAALGNFFVA